jgi:hypothetical protein
MLTQGYLSLNWPITYPEYVAITPSPKMRRKPGTSPTVASTEGSDSMPSEIVSAIMTITRSALCLVALGCTVLVLLTHTSLPARADKLGLLS